MLPTPTITRDYQEQVDYEWRYAIDRADFGDDEEPVRKGLQIRISQVPQVHGLCLFRPESEDITCTATMVHSTYITHRPRSISERMYLCVPLDLYEYTCNQLVVYYLQRLMYNITYNR